MSSRLVLCSLLVAGGVVAGGLDVVTTLRAERLTPAKIERPAPREVTVGGAHRISRCANTDTPPSLSPLPFAPGEQLRFDVALLGLHAGEIAIELDPLVNVDGDNVIPARGRVKTDGFVQSVGSFDVSMVTFLDVDDAVPQRMANRSVFRAIFDSGPTTTREDAVFADNVVGAHLDGGSEGRQVKTALDVFTDGRSTKTNTHVKSNADVVDTLGIVYWLRARELREGQRFCFEMFHRKKLWQVEAVVGGVASTTSPAMTRKARRLDVTILRAKKGTDARPMTVWISDDAERIPLRLTTPEHVEVELVARRPSSPASASSTSTISP